jgi:hypothetical protein
MLQQRTMRSLNAMIIMTIALILLNVLLTLKGLSPFQLLP